MTRTGARVALPAGYGTRLSLGSLCTGYGGLDLAAAEVLDVHPVWVADPAPGAAAVLAHRFPDVPNLGDLTAVDFGQVPRVDVLCAGFPCQDLSYAGRGAGIREGTRSGLWHLIADAVGVLRPRYLILENVAAIVARRPGLDVVLSDLAALGLTAEWACVRASDVGAPHTRNRWFLLAEDPHRATGGQRRQPAPGQAQSGRARPDARRRGGTPPSNPGSSGRQGPRPAIPDRRPVTADRAVWGPYAPAIGRWEHLTGRTAPPPTEPTGRDRAHRLSPRFVEWLMGLPGGWVTDVPGLSHNQQLTLLGNGVVPTQGAAALAALVDRITADTPSERTAA
ncbi:DNA cytosine methyltransferase [Actinomadura sp. 7K507]|uniref:DNA cytosine methyltransferase n=1 Tax=Actinomadura sp. 7K507 TaxID=2530365 RepID=UPI00104B59A1|nr:DNA cytosine methyltransferase [Actinomadura sp. 7K507]TDC76441.1 DNA cytosine methyltransferase [Actinomadura sp. 7K507]